MQKAKEKIFNYILSLKEQLQKVNSENDSLANEIKNQETILLNLNEHRIKAVEILTDKRNKNDILKNNIEIKRKYLESIVNSKKETLEISVFNFFVQLDLNCQKIEKLTEELNSIIQDNISKNKDESSIDTIIKDQNDNFLPLLSIDRGSVTDMFKK